MKIVFPKEASDLRVAATPQTLATLTKLGAQVSVEAGYGSHLGYTSEDFAKAGVAVVADQKALLADGDLVLRVAKPDSVDGLKKGAIHVSYLDPFNEKDLLSKLATAEVTAVSMELIPRTTLAQKMDALSSQASLAGYVAVILAAERLHKIFPMMMTPAGTIAPAKVFIIGAGVAGLQAIATAKRLGARVEAFDTRPVVEEQVKSLGGKFLKIDLGETGQTEGGYAKELTPEQVALQREGMKKACAASDVVITTAQVFGRKAPILMTHDMVAAMKPGSIIVDMAVESGGNVEGSKAGEEVMVGGVRIMGLAHLPARVALDASRMYAGNILAFVGSFWNKETKSFDLNLENEILKSSVVTHAGKILFNK